MHQKLIKIITMFDLEIDKAGFAEAFLKEFVSKGFGNYGKRDTDVLVYHLLTKDGVFKSMTNHQIAMMLRTTPTKVKNLKYESALRFPEEGVKYDDSYFKRKLAEYFKNPSIKIDHDWIYIQIEDGFLLDALKAKFKQSNEVLDGSFNNELVKVTSAGLATILDSILEDSDKKRIEAMLVTKIGLDHDFYFRSFASSVLEKLIEKGGDRIGAWMYDLLSENFPDAINMVLELL